MRVSPVKSAYPQMKRSERGDVARQSLSIPVDNAIAIEVETFLYYADLTRSVFLSQKVHSHQQNKFHGGHRGGLP